MSSRTLHRALGLTLSALFQVFDNTGRYLSTVNTGATPLYGPQGLAMSPEGHVIVADTGNHAIKFYTYHPLAA